MAPNHVLASAIIQNCLQMGELLLDSSSSGHSLSLWIVQCVAAQLPSHVCGSAWGAWPRLSLLVAHSHTGGLSLLP